MKLPHAEHCSEPGSVLKPSEDAAVVDVENGVGGVFDGASDLVGFTSPEGLTGGAIAAREAARVLRESTPDQSLLEIVLAANQVIDAIQRDFSLDPTDKGSRFCTTGAIARVRVDDDDNKLLDLLQVADSVAIVVYTDGTVEVPLGLYDHDQPTMRLWSDMVREGMTGDQIMKDPRMKSQIMAVREQSNDPDVDNAYGVLNGEDGWSCP